MGLKILHSADWHLDSPFTSFSEEERAFLKQVQEQIPERIAKLCREQQCQLVLLAGDLFDGAWTRETLDRVREALKACGCPVMISPGNHDPWGPGCPWTEDWPQNVHIFTPQMQSVAVKALDCRVYGAGFSNMDCGSLLENFHAEGEEKWKIGVFHGDPTNINSHYNPVTAAQIRNSGLQYLALGHVHTAGGLEAGNTVCSWPGCPMGRGWDETGMKGCLVTVLQESAEVRPVSLGLPGFFEETLSCDENGVWDPGSILPPAGSNSFYRIILEGCGVPDLDALYEETEAFNHLQFVDRSTDPRKLWAEAGQDSLRGAYFQKLKEAAEQAEGVQQKEILLAAEISQKLLEGREVTLP